MSDKQKWPAQAAAFHARAILELLAPALSEKDVFQLCDIPWLEPHER